MKIIITLLVFLFPLCLNAQNISSDESNRGNSKFKIGLILPLSGILQEYGQAARHGIDMAIKDRPELFTHIDLVYEDSQWDAAKAVAAFNKLRNFDDVNLIYSWGNPTTEALAPVALRQKFPLIAMSSDGRVSAHNPFVIRTINTAELLAKPLAAHLTAQGHKRMGIVVFSNSYVEGLYQGLLKYLPATTVLELVERVDATQQDFRATILKVRQAKYDALGVFLVSGQVSSFYKQLSASGLKLKTFGPDFLDSQNEVQASGEGIEDAVFSTTDITPKFQQAYLDAYKNDSQIAFAGNMYDTISAVAESFQGASHALSSEEVLARLGAIGRRSGVCGEYRLSEYPEQGKFLEFPVVLKVIKGGKILRLDPEVAAPLSNK